MERRTCIDKKLPLREKTASIFLTVADHTIAIRFTQEDLHFKAGPYSLLAAYKHQWKFPQHNPSLNEGDHFI